MLWSRSQASDRARCKTVERRPTLLHSCARAATAAEARFRVDYPNSTARSSRIVALDDAASSLVSRISGQQWKGAHFLTYKKPIDGEDGLSPDAVLESFEGAETRLSDELDGADVAVMIATADREAKGASIIGRACFLRGIMTAGLVLGDNGVDDAVTALRPYAAVLVVAADEDYVPDMLEALRA
jgi:hypothetical protein